MRESLLSIEITPKTGADGEKLARALGVLLVEDPGLTTAPGADAAGVVLGGTGEQHLEGVLDRLRRDFGVEAAVGRPEVVCRRIDDRLLEPLMRVSVRVHHDDEEEVLKGLSARDATILSVEADGDMSLIAARARLSQMFGFESDLRQRTHGRGAFVMSLHGYTPLLRR